MVNYLEDEKFLNLLQTQRLKNQAIKIIVYEKQKNKNLQLYQEMVYNSEHTASQIQAFKNSLENLVDLPVYEIQGKMTAAPSITVDGTSLIRRAGNISLVVDRKENDLTELDSVLALNKKIKIFVGIENNIDDNYDKICWLPIGVFIITSISLKHDSQGVQIDLNIKDKMALLNGECGGVFPTSVNFGEYDQLIEYKEIEYTDEIPYPEEPQEYVVYGFNKNGAIIYKTYSVLKGWEDSNQNQIGQKVSVKQRMYDIIKTAVTWYGDESPSNLLISDVPLTTKATVRYIGEGEIYYNTKSRIFTKDSNALITSPGSWKTIKYNEDCGYMFTDFTYPGELVTGVGENIGTLLNKILEQLGNFECYYDVEGRFVFQEKKNYLNKAFSNSDDLYDKKAIIDENTYKADFSNNSKTTFDFGDKNELIQSISNSPRYEDIKNDYHIWGEQRDGQPPIHYHVAIKNKPNKINGFYPTRKVVYLKNNNDEYTGKLRLAKKINDTDYEEGAENYTPLDWRAELYLQGLEIKQLGLRPDIYQNELLDLFDDIYNMKDREFKAEKVNNPNGLIYFLDFIDPLQGLEDISVESLGVRTATVKNDKIIKLYSNKLEQDIILIDESESIQAQSQLIAKCIREGYTYSRVPASIAKNIAIGTAGYSAEEVARDNLYQSTVVASNTSISCIPIYTLLPNTRIKIKDRESGVYGDYVINNMTLPLDGKSPMSISASKTLSREGAELLQPSDNPDIVNPEDPSVGLVKPLSYYGNHLRELDEIIKLHNRGEVDVTTVWQVGDILPDVQSGYDTRKSSFVVVDINHDILAEDNTKRAAVSFAMLKTATTTNYPTCRYSNYNNTVGNARYSLSDINAYLGENGNFETYYIPATLAKLIEPVVKNVPYPTDKIGNYDVETLELKYFIPSYWEQNDGSDPTYDFSNLYPKDGEHYPYFTSKENRNLGHDNGELTTRTAFWFRGNSGEGYARYYSKYYSNDYFSLEATDYSNSTNNKLPVMFCIGKSTVNNTPVTPEPLTVKPLAYYSNHLKELAEIIKMHNRGDVDVTTVWQVGDMLTDVQSGYNNNKYSFVIADINHDILVEDNTKRAAVSFAIIKTTNSNGFPYCSFSNGNSTTDNTRYSLSNIYTYLGDNGSFERTYIPAPLAKLVEPVVKYVPYATDKNGGYNIENLSLKYFIPSYWEYYDGSDPTYDFSNLYPKDGEHYPYFTEENRGLGDTSNSLFTRTAFWFRGESGEGYAQFYGKYYNLNYLTRESTNYYSGYTKLPVMFCIGKSTISNTPITPEPLTVKPLAYYGEHLKELNEVIEAHYNGDVDVTTVWSVGDTFEVVSGYSNSYKTTYVLVGTNKEILAEDNTKKAAVTFGLLKTSNTYFSDYMRFSTNYSAIDGAKYSSSNLHSYLNRTDNSFERRFIPAPLAKLVKTVVKEVPYPTDQVGGYDVERLELKYFVPSYRELMGTNPPDQYANLYPNDGEQYPYFADQNKRNFGLNSNYLGTRTAFWDSASNSSKEYRVYYYNCELYANSVNDSYTHAPVMFSI